jgi:hypothetical protein
MISQILIVVTSSPLDVVHSMGKTGIFINALLYSVGVLQGNGGLIFLLGRPCAQKNQTSWIEILTHSKAVDRKRVERQTTRKMFVNHLFLSWDGWERSNTQPSYED